MKSVCMIVIAALLVAIPLSLWSQDAPDGVQIFKTRCAACHGDKGEGLLGGKIPTVKGTALSLDKIVALLAKGEGGKTVHATPIVNLDDAQVKAVAEHVKRLK